MSYVWDQNAGLPVVLQDSAGNRYVYGLDLLTRINGTAEEWYLCDGLGSTTGLADAAGAVTGTYTYDAFGAVRAQSGATTEWSYTGEQHDPTGLEYLRARYYDAATARFVSRDPLPLVQRYAYAGNNPALLVDQTGLCCKVFKKVKHVAGSVASATKATASATMDKVVDVGHAIAGAASAANDVGVAASTKLDNEVNAARDWLSDPDNLDNVALAAQSVAGFTMTVSCGTAAIAPSGAVCLVAGAVYLGATGWQIYRANSTAGNVCVAATSGIALAVPEGRVGKVIDFISDLTGAFCEPGTAEASAAANGIPQPTSKEGDEAW